MRTNRTALGDDCGFYHGQDEGPALQAAIGCGKEHRAMCQGQLGVRVSIPLRARHRRVGPGRDNGELEAREGGTRVIPRSDLSAAHLSCRTRRGTRLA
jgi:hypothetical protein